MNICVSACFLYFSFDSFSHLIVLFYSSLLDFVLFYIYFDTSVFLMREGVDLYESADGRTWEKLGAPWSEYIAFKKSIFSIRKKSKRTHSHFFINCCYMHMYIYIYICIPKYIVPGLYAITCMYVLRDDYLVLSNLLVTSSSLERLFLPFSGFFNLRVVLCIALKPHHASLLHFCTSLAVVLVQLMLRQLCRWNYMCYHFFSPQCNIFIDYYLGILHHTPLTLSSRPKSAPHPCDLPHQRGETETK